jgi:hypothetical protein
MKNFKLDPSLLPLEGRDLQCGSCEKIWFFKVEDKNLAPLTLNEDFHNNEVEANLVKEDIINTDKDKKSIPSENNDKKVKKIKKILENEKPKINKENTGSKILSYLIVSIISFAVLIILIDTLKMPLINVFPGIEIILINLFETLKDIKLFIIDLS